MLARKMNNLTMPLSSWVIVLLNQLPVHHNKDPSFGQTPIRSISCSKLPDSRLCRTRDLSSCDQSNGHLDALELHCFCKAREIRVNALHWLINTQTMKHSITRVNMHYPRKHFSTECKSCLTSIRKTFLNRMQKLSNIHKQEREEMTEAAKICELFKHSQHPQVKALAMCYDMDGLTHLQFLSYNRSMTYGTLLGVFW